MFWLGKVLGSIFGFLIAGPFGAVGGLLLGHYFDLSRKGLWFFEPPPSSHTHAQDIFFRATFIIMGYIAKADGRISENEIRVATNIMQNMMLTKALRQQAIHYFNLGKRSHFNLDQILMELNNACFAQRSLLNLFLEIQLQAAYADGALTLNKQKILEHLCHRLGFNPEAFFFQRTYRQESYSRAQPHEPNQLERAYKTLGLSSSVTKEELKKRYRKLMSQNHPDKLVSKGLPEEMIKIATRKTQEIKSAYEIICKARGI